MPEDLEAARLVKAYKGLPKGVKHPLQMLSLFKKVSKALGLTQTAHNLYVYLFDKTNPVDWEGRSLAIVWPSNETIEMDLGICPKQRKRCFKMLRLAKLIAYKDSPSRQRFGHRDKKSQKINEGRTFGIVLNSIAGLYEEFVELAAVLKLQAEYKKKIRRTINALRNERNSLMMAAADVLDINLSIEFQALFEAIDAEYFDTGLDYAAKEGLILRLTELLDDLRDELTKDTPASAVAPLGASRHDLDRMQAFIDKKPREGGQNDPSIISITAHSPSIGNRLGEKGKDEGEGSSLGATARMLSEIERLEAKRAEQAAKPKHAYEMREPSLNQIKAALPSKIAKLIRDDHGIYEIYDIISEFSQNYGIPYYVMQECQVLMGKYRTAGCLAVIMDKHRDLRRPENYLRELMDRYRKKNLFIERSLFGIIKNRKAPLTGTDLFELPLQE